MSGRRNGSAAPAVVTREELDDLEALSRRFGLFAEEMRTSMDLLREGMKNLTTLVKDEIDDMRKRVAAMERVTRGSKK